MTLLFSHSSNCRFNASERINIKWFLRVYWLLPLSIVASFAEHRRFFCWAPTILLPSTDDSFAEHHKYLDHSINFISQRCHFLFQRTLFLFINWNSRMLGKSRTESTDTCQKTLLILLTKWSCRTRVFCWAAQRHGLALLDERTSMGRGISLSLRPEGRGTITESTLPVT